MKYLSISWFSIWYNFGYNRAIRHTSNFQLSPSFKNPRTTIELKCNNNELKHESKAARIKNSCIISRQTKNNEGARQLAEDCDIEWNANMNVYIVQRFAKITARGR